MRWGGQNAIQIKHGPCSQLFDIMWQHMASDGWHLKLINQQLLVSIWCWSRVVTLRFVLSINALPTITGNMSKGGRYLQLMGKPLVKSVQSYLLSMSQGHQPYLAK